MTRGWPFVISYKGFRKLIHDIHIYYEIFQVLLTKDGVSRNYSTVGFRNFTRGTKIKFMKKLIVVFCTDVHVCSSM